MASLPLVDWYDTPLYYDIVFDEHTATEADFLEATAERHGRAGGRSVLEIACGSGRLVAALARRGWKTAGFDGNPAMLDFASGRLTGAGLDSLIWKDCMESFAVPRKRTFDLAHCLVSTFKYLLSEGEALACLERVALALKPGGLFVLGIHLTDPGCSRPTHERWVARRDGIEVVCNTRTWPPCPRTRIERMRSRLRVTLPDGQCHRQETRWQVRSYTAAQVRSLLRKCPALSLVACHDFRHDPEETRRLDDEYSDVVLVLRKSR